MKKTEPYYFQGCRDAYSLNTANVEICGDCGSSPVDIYKYARQRYRQEKDAGDPYDRVYCVFDKDSHTTYQQALDSILRSTPRSTFFAITSIPCFEYWILLHFVYSTRPFNGLPGNSACNQLIAELRNHLPGYTKGDKSAFSTLESRLNFAIHNATRVSQSARKNHEDNPSTRVHELVEFLLRIKQTRQNSPARQ